jgi:PPM family protein phosphatase
VRFDYGICATIGARKRQEDAARVLPLHNTKSASGFHPGGGASSLLPALAAVLADGMGGHTGGAIASELACEAFLPEVINGDAEIVDRLRDGLSIANSAIATYIEADPTYSGMGATLIGAIIDQNGLQWISVGDSLLYLVRAGHIQLLNADHSLAPEIDRLAELGHISWSEALADPRRHYLRSAVTGDELDLIDSPEAPLKLAPGDIIVLASDGLNALAPAAVATIVAEHPRASATDLSEHLIKAVVAKALPHQDNTTVVIVRAHTA